MTLQWEPRFDPPLPKASLYGLGQFNVAISDRLPKEVIGTRIYWAHPIIQWLARYSPIRPYVIGGPIEQEQALIVGNRVFMSPLMWAAFKNDAAVVRGDCA